MFNLFRKKEKVEDIPVNKPRCIAVIMDGNGRWAKKRSLPRTAGHSVGANTFKKICIYANSIGIEYMIFYAFSTENWNRPESEVNKIMGLLVDYLKDIASMKKYNIKLTFIGDRSRLSDEIRQLMSQAEEITGNATGLTVALAINYGGRDEIVHAVKNIAEKVKDNTISIDDINEELIDNYMYLPALPNPDLIIRPSGEFRLSNFLTWQSAYSEFWFSNVLWPDFSEKDLDEAIRAFSNRDRRFGGVKEEGKSK